MIITAFEHKVLSLIAKGTNIQGNGMVAYVAAARRLERKGLASKGTKWRVTAAGREALDADTTGACGG